MGGGFRLGEHHVGHDNHHVARLHQPCGGAVQADGAAAALAGDGVGFQPRAVVVVDDLDFFINENAGGVQQIQIDGNAADVVEIGFGNGDAVDLAAEQGAEHGVCAFRWKKRRIVLNLAGGFDRPFRQPEKGGQREKRAQSSAK